MNSAPNDPWQDPPSFKGMEDALRDACERAMQLVFPLPTMLRLYRSVIGLTRALMQARVDVGLPPGLSDDLIGRLDAVRDTTGMHFPDQDMPVQDAIRLHSAIMKLASIAHRARVGRLTGSLVGWARPHVAAPQTPAEPEGDSPVPPPALETADVDAAPSEWRTRHEPRPLERPHTVRRAEPDMRRRAEAAAA
jgi:hypothetical protein